MAAGRPWPGKGTDPKADYAAAPMLDPRVYRAALLPVLLALIVVAFSLENRPGPLRTTLTADAFDGARPRGCSTGSSRTYPERRAGGARRHARSPGASRRELRAALPGVARAAPGDVAPRRPTATASSSPCSPSSRAARRAPSSCVVAAPRRGRPRRRRAALRHRRADRAGPGRSRRRGPSRSVTFASVSGETGGQGGMRDARRSVLDRPVDAMLELGDLAGPVSDRPLVVPWSDGAGHGADAPAAHRRARAAPGGAASTPARPVRARAARAVRLAVVAVRARASRTPPGSRPCASRRAASRRRAAERPGHAPSGWATSAAPRCARSPRSRRARASGAAPARDLGGRAQDAARPGRCACSCSRCCCRRC